MYTRAFSLVSLALFGSMACGSNDRSQNEVLQSPLCKGQPVDDCFIEPKGLPFVRSAFPVTDGASTGKIKNPEPGKVCLSGTLADAGPTANWGAILILGLVDWTDNGIVAAFDATALGVAEIQFELDTPPVTGIRPEIGGILQLECPERSDDCIPPFAFALKDAQGLLRFIRSEGQVTVPISAFSQPDWGDADLVFDPTRLSALNFSAGTLQGMPLEYDFCISGLKFLDANGDEITAPG